FAVPDAAVIVNVSADSAGTTASSLPVAAATPVPAPAPSAVPISAPLPPPAIPPINAPAAAPPPIFVALLLVWPLPLKEWDVVETGTPLSEVKRRVSWPGAWRRPLDFADVTLPRTGVPALATVLPLTTTSCARLPWNACPDRAVAELICELVRMVSLVPAGIWAPANAAASIIRDVVFRTFPSMSPPRDVA